MGLKANVVNATFDGIIPGLASGKYDLGMSSFTDTKEREKTVDFVTYFSAGHVVLRQGAGRPDDQHASPTSAATRSRPRRARRRPTDAAAQGKKCTAAGKPAVTVLGLPGPERREPGALSGRADVGMADSPVADYQVKKSNGQFKLVGQALRHGAVRHRDPQGQRHGQAACSRP